MKTHEILLTILGLFLLTFLIGEKVMTTGSALIEKMADAIQQFEGWVSGSRSMNNNNPGNLRYSASTHWQGQTGYDDAGFVIFDSYENGRRALVMLLTNAATGALKPSYDPALSLYRFFQRYAPSLDNNNPTQYAQFVANYIGVDPNTAIGTLV